MEAKIRVTIDQNKADTPHFVALCNFLGPEKHVKHHPADPEYVHYFRTNPFMAEQLFEKFDWVRTVDVILERVDYEIFKRERQERQEREAAAAAATVAEAPSQNQLESPPQQQQQRRQHDPAEEGEVLDDLFMRPELLRRNKKPREDRDLDRVIMTPERRQELRRGGGK